MIPSSFPGCHQGRTYSTDRWYQPHSLAFVLWSKNCKLVSKQPLGLEQFEKSERRTERAP